MSGRSRCAFVAAILAVGCLSLLSSASAAVVIWTGSTVDLNWATAGNWGVSGVPLADSDVILPTPIPNPSSTWPNPESISLDTGSLANSLTARDSYTLSNGNLTVTSGAITVATGSTLTISSALTGSGGLILAANNGLAGGDAQTGGGTLVLNWTNTYLGDTVIEAGTLAVNSDANLGNSSAATAITFAAGGTGRLQITQTGFSSYKGITLTGDGDVNILNAGDTATLGGVITGAGKFTKSGAGILVLSGTNTNSGVVSITGGTLSISAGNNLGNAAATNTLAIAGGTLQWTGGTSESLGATRTLSIGSGGATVDATGAGTLTIDGVISGSDNLTKTGGGILALTADNSAYAGNIIVNGGVLRSSSTVNSLGTGNLMLNGGVYAYGGTSTTFTRTLGTGSGEVQIVGGVSGFGTGVAGPLTVNLGGSAAEVIWGTASFNPTALILNDASSTSMLTFLNPLDLNGADRTIQVDGTGGATIASIISSTGGGGLIKNGTGTLVLSGNNTFGGGFVQNGGLVNVNHSAALGTGTARFASGAQPTRMSLGNGVNVTNALTMDFVDPAAGRGALEGPATGTGTWSGPIQINAASASGGHFAGGGGTLVLAGPITAPAGLTVNFRSGNITLQGGGSYTLAGIGEGTTKLGANNGMSTTAVLTVASAATGTFDLAGFNQTLAGLKNTNTATVTNSGATASTLTFDVPTGTNSSYAGTITNLVTLVKTGPGAQTLSGAITTGASTVAVTGGTLTLTSNSNNFTGNVTVDGSTSVLAFAGQNGAGGDPNSLGAGTKFVTLTNGGTIRPTSTCNPTGTNTKQFVVSTGGGTFDVGNGITFQLDDDLQFSGAGDLTITGSGTGTVFMNTKAYTGFTGNVTINSGTLKIGNTNSLGNTAGKTVTVNSGGVFDVQAANVPQNVILNGTGISGGGALINSGTSATASIAGTVTLGSAVSVGGTGTGSLKLNGAVSGSYGLTKVGTNTVTLAADNSAFTGPVVANGGLLGFTALNALGNGSGTNTITLNGGGISYDAATGLTFTRTVNVGASGGMIGVAQAAGPLTFNTANLITSGGVAVTMTKTGAGTLNLNVANPNLNASWSVTGGILSVTSRAALGTATSSPITVSSGGAYRPMFTNATVASAGTAGLNATYYNTGLNPNATTNPSQFATDLLYLAPRAFSRVDANVNVPFVTSAGEFPIVPIMGFAYGTTVGGQNDAIMWKGLLNITNAATYQFLSAVDDNDILYIDGVAVGSHAGNTGGVVTALGSIALSAGPHSIAYKMTNGGTVGYAVLQYSGGAGSDAPTQVTIPATAFTTGSLAALDVGPIVSTGGGLDIVSPASTASLTLGNGAFTVTSPTIDNLNVSSATINAATPTLAPTTGGLIFSGPIGQDVAGRALTVAGPYFTEFQAANTYDGLTTVTGGQLRLNTTGNNSIAGDLTVNAPNANGALNNVVLLQSNQIVDTATVTMTAGILSLGSNSETVANLAMSGGAITGAGTLTVTNAPTLTAGTIAAKLAGTFALNKTGAGAATLSGNNTYAGVTTVTTGILNASGANALGAGGAGNGTTVADGATLRTLGGISATEDVTISGAGLVGDTSEAALRNLGGTTQIGSLTTGAVATVRVDSGELIINGTLNVGSGALTKTGNGTLTFATNQASIPAVTHTAGAIGFSGTANTFGAQSVPVGLAYQFNSSQAASTIDLTVPAGATVIGNFAFDNTTLINKLNAASTGTLALATDNANALSLAGVNLSLGATGLATYTGTLTPNAAGYRLGGGGGKLSVNAVLAGAYPLEINGDVQLNALNAFTGTTTIKTAGRLDYVNNNSLGATANVLTLDGGTLRLIHTSDTTGGTAGWVELGYPSEGSGRVVNVGSGGGTIDIPARQAQGNFAVIYAPNTITGSGPMTKTGLGFLSILSSNDYSGALTIAANANRVDLRSTGALPNVASVTIEVGGRLDVDNNSTLGTTRLLVSVDNRNRLNDAASITLNGGTLRFVGRNVAFTAGSPATSQENFGTTTLGIGQSIIQGQVSGGGGSDMVIANFVRAVGSGVVQFSAESGTLGQPGNNPRIILSQVNGNAPTVSSLIGGWATIGGDFAAYGANSTVGGATGTATGVTAFGAANAPAYTALTTTTAPNANGWVTGSIGSAAADVTLGTTGAGQNFVVGALRLAGGATRQILFGGTTGTADTLYVESGGVLSENVNNARNIGLATSAFTRGRLTAGTTTATTPQELFFHMNQSTMTINAQVIDNPNNAAATVKVVKAQGGTVTLDNSANTYSGGTLVLGGTLTANNTGSLGTGSVLVKNAQLNLGNKGSTTGVGVASNAAVYSLLNQSILVLTSGSTAPNGTYNGAGDRFSLAAGSTIYANSPGANAGFNSLTRVATPTSFGGGGQIYLEPGAIVKHNMTNAPNQGAGVLTIQNLGTAADLFFAPVTAGNTAAFNQTITVGAGTPWAGLSSDRGNLTWNAGTIYANSDFTLQGLVSNGAISALTLGENTTSTQTATKSGGVQIVNNTNGPINAKVVGVVTINEDEPVSMPSNLTFVLTAGSLFQPNTSAAMGFGSSQAKILIQAGGILDPGNYTALGSAANQTLNPNGTPNGFQSLPYAIPSPVNGQVTVEAGGKFIINDASGIGSAPAGSYTIKTDGVLELGSTSAFYGRGTYGLTQTGTPDTTGVAVPGQFVYESGAVVRLGAPDIYKLSQFTPATAAFEIFGADRTISGQSNPFIIPAVGTPTIAPEDLTLNNGGMLTNDNSERTVADRRGRLVLGDGAILASTSGTFFYIQEGINVDAGASVFIGTTRYVDGMPKLGAVQLTGANSTFAGAGASFTVANGAMLSFAAANVFPDTTPISLPSAVTAYPGTGGFALLPADGSKILLNVANFMEYVGAVTGSGTVMANQGGTALAMNITSDTISNVVFKSTNGQNPSLVKAGPNKLTLTGASDSQGWLFAQQGEVVVTGTGDWAEAHPQRGGKITVDNTSTPANNHLGTPAWLVGQGGTFELIGNATTAVTETITSIGTGSGNFINVLQNPMQSVIKITPGAATTKLAVDSLENFQSSGQRLASYIIQSPSVSNLPGTYASATGTAYTPNAGNTTNGLVTVAQTNFASQNSNNVVFGIGPAGTLLNPSGSPLVPVRPDYLADVDGDGVADGFMTADGGIYRAGTIANGSAVVTGINTTGLTVGQRIAGTYIPAGATIVSIDSATQLTMSANAPNNPGTYALSIPNENSYLRALAATEYAPALRDNLNTMLNVKLTGTTSTSGDTRIATLTLTPGSVLNLSGTLPLNATSGRLHLNAGGIFVQSGGSATINGSTAGATRTFLQANGGAALFLHTQGDLDLNAAVFSDLGVVKTGPGTLNVGDGAFNVFRGTLQIDGGVVNLGPNNYFANIRAQSGFTSNNNLYLNAGTLNLNGNSIIVNLLNSANELPGQGGTVTSTSAATLTTLSGGRFAGSIGGAISLDKPANNTLLLTNTQTYTGTTTVRAGTLVLRDSAKLSASAGAVSVLNATLQIDNGYLSNVANRINPATPVTLSGGTLNMTGAAGQVSSQTINSLTLNRGLNNLTNNAGGSGAIVVNVGKLVRPQGPNGSGATLNYQQNYGFLGTAGDTTTAIRHFITNVNDLPLALNDGIIAGWAVVAGDNFATYLSTTGVGAMGNTVDGYANYESTNATTATATQNVNDGTARTFAANTTINSWRIAPNAAVTMTINAGVGLTIDTGGLLTNNNNTTTFASGGAGSFLTSNSGELDVWVNQNTTSINVPITGGIDLVKSGGGTLNLGAVNTYTGRTIANGGTLQGALAAANGTTVVSVPGDLYLNAATFTETVANQLKTNANLVVSGGGKVQMMNAAGITETIGSLTFLDGSSATATTTGLDRSATQPTSTIILSAATAITATNTNPSTGVPFIGGYAGNVAFSNASGATLNINSAPAAAGNAPTVGLRIGAAIGAVPTLAEGGLIKSGNGLLTLDPDQTVTNTATTITSGNTTIMSANTAGLTVGMPISGTGIPTGSFIKSITPNTSFVISQAPTAGGSNVTLTGTMVNFNQIASTYDGTLASLVDVLNVSSGVVRADRGTSLGSNSANTTVQSGAVLLGANSSGQTITGSIKLKGGATLGATINGFTLGVATTTVANQSVLNIDSGTVNIAAYDYYVPGTNSGNITVNGRLTGAGNINLIGQQITQGNGAGGYLQLGNPILTGTGANDFSGTITVGQNAMLINRQALVAPATSITGNELGAATINLNGGRLQLRDDLGTANANVSNTSITYGNNVTLSADSFLDANRATGTGTGNTIALGTLTVPSGAKVLTVDSSNAYSVRFAQLNGPGMLIKGGASSAGNNNNSRLIIESLGTGANTPSFGIAGPDGVTVGPTFNHTTADNVTFTPATIGLQDFSINGLYITPASKTFNVAGTFAVNANPGSKATLAENIAAGQANVAGRVAVTNTTAITAGTIANNGVIGPIGGAVTLTATTGFTGAGAYVTTSATGGATSSQPLTLAGNVTSGTLRTAGLNTVTVTGAAHTPTAAEVQSGTLKFLPALSATTSGDLKVFGSPASAASATSAPIAAVTGTLDFAATTGNSVTHSGNITNSGVVKVSSGTAIVNGTISGSATPQYVPGLLEGLVTGTTGFTTDNTRPANPGNFGVQMEPRMLQNNSVTQQALTGHIDNEVWVYTGYVKDDDGVFSFAGNQDDNLGVWIDGTLALNIGGNRVGSTAFKDAQAGTTGIPNANSGTPSQNFGPGITIPGYGAGWHLIEVRMRNGTGGAGPYTNNGFTTNYGFGYKNGIGALDGADYVKPIDNGAGSLFLTPMGAKGNVQVDAGATLNVQQVAMTNRMILGAAASGGATVNLNHTSAAASAVDNLEVTGATGTATLTTNANTSLTVGNFTGATGTTLTHASPSPGPANRLVITGNAAGGTINSTGAAGVTFNSAAAQAASSVIAGNGGLVKEGDGTLTLSAINTYSGATQITAGTVKLSGWGGAGGPFTNVPEAAGYKTVYKLSIPDYPNLGGTGGTLSLPTGSPGAYSENHSTDGTITAGSFSRVGYYLELKKPTDTASTWVWVSMDAVPFTTDLTKMGVPVNGTIFHYDAAALLAGTPNSGQVVNMNVATNAASGVTAGTGITTGNVEFWPSNYTQANDYGVPGASGTLFDFGDGGASATGGGHGSMQIFNYATGETLFGMNKFNSGGTQQAAINIGSVTRADGSDGTFNYNSLGYTVKDLWVLVGNTGVAAGATNLLPDTTRVEISSGAALDLAGNSEVIGSLAGVTGATVSLGAGTLTTGGNGDHTTFAGSIAGTGGVIKTGIGTMTLSGANSYSGPTDVQAGTLVVNGSVTGAGNVTVASGATLGGGGSLAGAVAVQASGFIAPNGLTSDTGTLNLGSTLTINGTAKFELGAAASDKIVVIGAADFNGGTLDVTALTVGGPTFTNGQVFDLFDYASYTNPFTTINLPLLTGGLQWKSFGAQQFDYTNGQIVVESTVVTSAIRTWNGGSGEPGGNNLWSTAANWGTSGIPANNTPKDELVFGGGTWLANNNDIASLSVGKLTFASGAGGFNLQGNALEIAGKIDNQATTAQKISLDVTFAAGTETATLNVVNGGSLELVGAVNSTLGLTKTGLGTAKLSAGTGTTYSGPTLVNEGTLEVTKGINLVADTDDTTVGTSITTATLITEHIRQDVLTINAGSKVKISATGGAASTSVVNVLNIANASGSFSWSVPGGDISPASTGGPVASGAAVPEPATWLLAVIAALAGLVAWRRRK